MSNRHACAIRGATIDAGIGLTAFMLALAAFAIALVLGLTLGPAMQLRLDEFASTGQRREWRPRVFAAAAAALPFAALAATTAPAVGCALAAALGWLPGLLRRAHAPEITKDREARIEAIDRLLPQTQCGQCSFAGCRPYATAIVDGVADIDQCPPGGAAGIAALAELLGRARKPLNPAHGIEKPPRVARIVEADCIGCTKCIQACPVDAIVGARQRMHTVIADLCTGCELCVPPCPVDCIQMVPPPE